MGKQSGIRCVMCANHPHTMARYARRGGLAPATPLQITRRLEWLWTALCLHCNFHGRRVNGNSTQVNGVAFGVQ